MATLFTQIIKGEIPCYKIYEDDKTFALLDIRPESKGHSLIIPKVEVDKGYELPEEDYDALWRTVKIVAKKMEEAFGKRTVFKLVGTEVPHAHVHMMPFDENWEAGKNLSLSEEEFKEIQEKLKIN